MSFGRIKRNSLPNGNSSWAPWSVTSELLEISYCHGSFHYSSDYSTTLFLAPALGQLVSNNISDFPWIAKEIPVYCNQYIISTLTTKQLYIDFFNILYSNMYNLFADYEKIVFFHFNSSFINKESHSAFGLPISHILWQIYSYVFMDFIKDYEMLVKSLWHSKHYVTLELSKPTSWRYIYILE